MNERGKRQASSLFGGMGFYIALLVCVLAAGVVGYFALLNNPTDETEPGGAAASTPVPSGGQAVDSANPGPSQSVTAPSDTPSLPVMDRQPDTGRGTEPVSTPREPDTDDTPGTATLPLGLTPEDVQSLDLPGDTVPAMSPSDIPAEEPLTVTAPLAGETVAVFSVDQLTYNATLDDWRTHDGIDIQAEAGTPVVSAAAGTVLSIRQDSRLGTTVVVEHAGGYATTYASLQPEVSVLAGDELEAGAPIGTVGNTSITEAGLGAHLHFSVTKDGAFIDPAQFLGEQN